MPRSSVLSRALFAFALLLAARPVAGQFVGDLVVRDERLPRLGRPGPPRLAPIVIERHAVRVAFVDGVATTKVRQVFRNPNQWQVEGTFFFALPEDAALSGFAMLMGGKMVEGEVLAKERAAEIYRNIVAKSLDPALLEYVGRRLFQAKVFPLPALGTAEIELSYSETLVRGGDLLEYRYPLRTAGPSPVPVTELSLAIEAESKTPLRAVYSPSHAIDLVKKGDYAFKASFEQKPCVADRDFTLVVGLGADPVGATLLTHVEEGGDGAFLLLLSPSDDASKNEVVAKDVVFVADTSGSMAGEKLGQLKRALAFCVKSLDPRDRFNLVSFSTEARPWRDGLAAVDATSKEAALKYVEDLRALGGTNISDALASALAIKKDPNRPFVVIFLTDGMPTVGVTNVDAILKDVAAKREAATRLFVFGVGHDVNTTLLDRLADENRGARDYVGEREDLELKLSSFFTKFASPVLANLKVAIDGVATSDVHPKALPDLFRGAQLLLTGRYSGAGAAKVRVTGDVNGRAVAYDYSLTFGSGGKDPSIARLWAVRKAGYLIDQIRLNGESKELKDEVVRLGVKYGIVTPYTSYLVVEDTPATAMRPGADPAPLRDGLAADRVRRLDAGVGGGGGGTTAGRGGDGKATPGAAAAPAPSAKPAGGKRADKDDRAGKEADLVEALDEEAADAAKNARGRFERERALEELKKGWGSDPVALSREVLKLRDAQAGGGRAADASVRRVGDRTFYLRAGLYVEASALKLDEETLKTKVTRIAAFGDAYFALIARRPALAAVVALGDVLFVDEGVVYLVTAPEAAPESRPER